MKLQIVKWGNAFFSRPWRLLPAQPVLYFFVLLTAWNVGPRWILYNLSHHEDGDADFMAAKLLSTGHGTLWIWVFMGMFAPLLFYASMWLTFVVKGQWLYRGMWWRLASDIGMFVFFAMFAVGAVGAYGYEQWHYEPFHLNLTLFAVVFCGLEMVRDTWSLVIVAREEKKLRHELH